MPAKMILTGDVNLMNVTDPSVPFAQVADEFHRADVVFSESRMLPRHSGRAFGEQRGLLRRSQGRRGVAAGRHSCRRHRQQRALRHEQHPLLDRAARRIRRPPHRRRQGPRRGAGAGDRRAQRDAVRLSPAQLGLLADRSRGAQGRRRDRGHPRPHRLPRAGVQDPGRGAAAEPPRRAAADHHLGRPRLSRMVPRGPRRAAPRGRRPGRVVPLGARARGPQIHDRDRACRDRRRRRPRHRPRAALLPAGRGLQGASRSSTASAASRSTPAMAAGATPSGSA